MSATNVTVGDLGRDELELIAWSGSAAHLRNVAGQLERRDAGKVDYLVARDDRGPVAKGAVDYEEFPGAGSIMQLATRDDLQGQGLATLVIAEAERRMRARGLGTARLAVEPDNERALRLYLHLGYRSIGERATGWEYERPDGTLGQYRTTVVDLVKDL